MAGCVVHVRVPEHVLAELDQLCHVMQQTRSAAIRQSLRYVLDHPELWAELLMVDTTTTVDDPRTPAQVAAWEQNKERLTRGPDLSLLLRQN
jgi:hypothetical protein